MGEAGSKPPAPEPATIEQRWRERFTGGAIDALRTSLEALATAPDGEPPPTMPASSPGTWSTATFPGRSTP